MAKGRPVSLRIPDEARAAIQETMRRTGRDFSSVANEMLTEATRMRRIPGIVFADGPTGRRARVAGTGLDVFEVVRAYRKLGQDWERLRQAYDWLTEQQLRAALAYAEAYPEEIEERLRAEEQWTGEAIWARHPFMRRRQVRFYLDEDLSPRIADIGRGLGLDVVSAIELGHRGLDDADQLLLAARDGRCLVTENRADFVRLTTVFFEDQRPHAGVLLLPDSLPTDHFTGIAPALEAYAQAHAGAPMAYVVDYL